MDVLVVEPGRVDAAGGEIVARWLRAEPAATFLAAVGTSPLGVYNALAELTAAGAAGEVDVRELRLVQLDEYVGVADDDRRCLFGWLLRDVARRLGVDGAQVLRLAGDAVDPAAEAARHDAAIVAAAGLGVSVLGIGPNGHLGFNEPPSAPDAPTRVVDLAEASVTSNAHYWGSTEAVPRRAITVGMDRLLAARRTLVVVKGAGKREILRQVVAGPITDDVPASHLRRASGVVLLADDAAWPSDIPVPVAIEP